MRKHEQTTNRRIASAFAFLLIALIGFWAGYVVHLLRLPHVPVPGQDAPMLLVQFVDVGDGDAALATTPAGMSLLIDAGPDADAAAAVLTQLQRLHRARPTAILLTSERSRSIGGAAYLVTRCAFRGIIVLPAPLPQFARLGGEPARQLLTASKKLRLRLVSWQDFESSADEPATLSDSDVVATPIAAAGAPNGAGSLAVRLDLRGGSGGGSVLYAAGLTNADEDRLIGQRARLQCDILAATNGGHDGSLSSEFLALTQPTDVCLSDSAAAPPDTAVLERLNAADTVLHRTDLLRTVTLGLTGQLGQPVEVYGPDAALPPVATSHNDSVRPS